MYVEFTKHSQEQLKSENLWCDQAPLGFADGPNKYQYAGNDPVNFRDPSGLSQAGNPLNNLAGGFGGNFISDPIDFNSTLTHNTTIGSILDFGGPSQFSSTPNPFLSSTIDTLSISNTRSVVTNPTVSTVNNFISSGIQNVGNFIGQASNNFASTVDSAFNSIASTLTPAAPARIKPVFVPKQVPNNALDTIASVTIPNALKLPFGLDLSLGPNKSEITKGLKRLNNPKDLGGLKPLAPGKVISATQKNHIVVPKSALGPNDLVGTGGAGPCVGAIICERNGPNSRIIAFHFDSLQNPVPSITQFKDSFKKGPGIQQPDVFIFGGDNTPTSNTLLKSVVNAFTKPNFQIQAQDRIQVIDRTGLFVDQNGVPTLRSGDGTSSDFHNKLRP